MLYSQKVKYGQASIDTVDSVTVAPCFTNTSLSRKVFFFPGEALTFSLNSTRLMRTSLLHSRFQCGHAMLLPTMQTAVSEEERYLTTLKTAAQQTRGGRVNAGNGHLLLAQSLDSRRKFIIKNKLKLTFPVLKVKKKKKKTSADSQHVDVPNAKVQRIR